MRWRFCLLPLLLASACSSSTEPATCEFEGRTYRVGEWFSVDCNTCMCDEDGGVACTGAVCVDTGPPPGDAGDADTTPGGDAGLACATTADSSLTGAHIAFPDQRCVFTLAEAAAGIEIDYDVIIDAAQPDVTARPQDAGCGTPGPSGLIAFERLSGGGQSYCLCDTGLCPGGEMATTMVVGEHRGTFGWMGRNWEGPSDFGNPMGDPFPPGTYSLEVSALGTVGGEDYRVVGTFAVHLMP